MMRLLDERTRYERAIVDTREQLVKEAKQLQAVEYERRLSELNNSHADTMAHWQLSLPREVFDDHLLEFRTWRDHVNSTVTAGLTFPTALAALQRRVGDSEQTLQQAMGALNFIRFMGFAGVLALLVTFARMAKLMP